LSIEKDQRLPTILIYTRIRRLLKQNRQNFDGIARSKFDELVKSPI